MIVNDNTFSKIEIIKKDLTTSSIWHPLHINYALENNNQCLQFRLLPLNQRIISKLGYYFAKVGLTNYQRKKWIEFRHNKKQQKKVQNSI